jgi:mercuric ion binding protein
MGWSPIDKGSLWNKLLISQHKSFQKHLIERLFKGCIMKGLIIITIILAVIIYPSEALTGEEAGGPVKVSVRVDGLSCPFCAYGLEKKIKNMEGVEDLSIFIEHGKIEVVFKDKKFTPREIKVKDISG